MRLPAMPARRRWAGAGTNGGDEANRIEPERIEQLYAEPAADSLWIAGAQVKVESARRNRAPGASPAGGAGSSAKKTGGKAAERGELPGREAIGCAGGSRGERPTGSPNAPAAQGRRAGPLTFAEVLAHVGEDLRVRLHFALVIAVLLVRFGAVSGNAMPRSRSVGGVPIARPNDEMIVRRAAALGLEPPEVQAAATAHVLKKRASVVQPIGRNAVPRKCHKARGREL